MSSHPAQLFVAFAFAVVVTVACLNVCRFAYTDGAPYRDTGFNLAPDWSYPEGTVFAINVASGGAHLLSVLLLIALHPCRAIVFRRALFLFAVGQPHEQRLFGEDDVFRAADVGLAEPLAVHRTSEPHEFRAVVVRFLRHDERGRRVQLEMPAEMRRDDPAAREQARRAQRSGGDDDERRIDAQRTRIDALHAAATAAHAQMPTSPWKKGAPFPEPDEELYGVAANGKLYVMGGWADGKARGANYEYDPATDILSPARSPSNAGGAGCGRW